MEECCICYETLYSGHKLECGHLFHENCIEQCKKDVCPLCRQPFKLITNIYILELTTAIQINKNILIHSFPTLEKETFNIIIKPEYIIVLYFQFSERRDKWFNYFTPFKKEIIKLDKSDIKIDIRKLKNRS
jgi:hypothetical protein